MNYQTSLGAKMAARADADGLGGDHALRNRADEFESAASGFYAEEQTVSAKCFIGAWARANNAWSEYTGEPLL
ncbi:hypothetical protein [Vreelandella sp. EE22]